MNHFRPDVILRLRQVQHRLDGEIYWIMKRLFTLLCYVNEDEMTNYE